MSNDTTRLSVFLCRILRHEPGLIGEPHEVMDIHGWVSTNTLIKGVNSNSKFHINRQILEKIVAEDNKGRYRFKDNNSKIKCCQGHSIPWVIPELEYKQPPEFLYHGTNSESMTKIYASGHISKMSRHAVHMQPDIERARQSADRWHSVSVILKIAALEAYKSGIEFGESENGVWCAEEIPTKFIVENIYI